MWARTPSFAGVAAVNTARTAGGDLQLPRVLLTDPGAIAVQGAVDVLSLWQGTYFLDTAAGFPWLQSILGAKGLSATLAESLLEQAILTVPYVVSVDVSVFFDSKTRAFAYSFEAPLATGQVLVGGSAQAFHVRPAPGGS